MIRPEVVERLRKIDFDELDRGTRQLQETLYKKGLTNWVDRSWEHPDPNIDAIFGDLCPPELSDRHGHAAPYLDSCMRCANPDCHRGKDAGWTCKRFVRMVEGIP